MTRLQVLTERRGEMIHLSLLGELDLSCAERLESALAEAERGDPPVLLIDLSRLEFLDSTGLRLLVTADKRARESGRRLAVVRGPEQVHRVFEITGLDKHLELVDEASSVSG